jgi:hypothetical protein
VGQWVGARAVGCERVGGTLLQVDYPAAIGIGSRVVCAQEIDDPTDEKPKDWVDEAQIKDPDAVKPDDWDESAPATIPDEDAVKPEVGGAPVRTDLECCEWASFGGFDEWGAMVCVVYGREVIPVRVVRRNTTCCAEGSWLCTLCTVPAAFVWIGGRVGWMTPLP